MDEDVVRAGLDDWHRRRAQPSNELPVVLGLSQVIGEADGVLVALGALRVFSNGVGFDVLVRVRGGLRAGLEHELHDVFASHGYGQPAPLAERCLLGVEFADGRRASTLAAPWPDPLHDDPLAPQFDHQGGGGGGGTYDLSFWLSPLPPPGPLTVVCVWPVAGIPETSTVLDGTALAEAAGRVRPLWPWEPEQAEPEPLPPPERPATGWFAGPA